jgi:uncharacterized membrane protein YeaQ/YmgE (transglycosylase-associated protein family)
MFLILFIVTLALASGWVAQMILGRTSRRNNWGEAFVAGLLGSFVGGMLASLIAGDGLEFRPSGVIGSIVGAEIVLAVWGAIRGRSPA